MASCPIRHLDMCVNRWGNRRTEGAERTRLQALGTGCLKCKKLGENAEAAAKASGVEYTMEKVTDIAQITGRRFDGPVHLVCSPCLLPQRGPAYQPGAIAPGSWPPYIMP